MAKTKRTFATKDAFFAGALQRQTEVVFIAGIGNVMVRGMTAKERDQYETSCIVQKNGKRNFNLIDARAKLVMLTVVDENNDRLFDASDVSRLSGMPASVIDKLFTVAQKLSGISDEDIDDLGLDSGEGPRDSSPLGLPLDSEG
jgi:hypothetical protein|tara:strand:- start:23 stop:454 length:432 start_codon:yes stop_codon:yes gene_type:complete